MIEYTLITVLSLALCLTYWRKNVWRRRYKIVQNQAVYDLAMRSGVVILQQAFANKEKEWPETID